MLRSVLIRALLLASPLAAHSTLPGQQAVELPVSGRAEPALEVFDDLMRDFMVERDVVGAALAVSHRGRLVYARGFGYADLSTRQPMGPDASFRIASLSKPITSATLVALSQRGDFDLDDPVLEHVDSKLLGGSLPQDERWADITLRMLLQHTAGFDRLKTEDPMFRSRSIARALHVPSPPTADQVIKYMFGFDLDFDPGERYAYSNFGYSLLGRVIEHRSGDTYEATVQKTIAEPMGMKTLRQGKSLASERLEGEVRYHDDGENLSVFSMGRRRLVSVPYGTWYQESLDSPGGWICSAPDLLRFARLFDEGSQDGVLSKDSVADMFARPKVSVEGDEIWYGLGWQVRKIGSTRRNTWHMGYLPGSESLLVRRQDGLSWAVLFNSRGGEERLATAIDPLIHRAADTINHWPPIDLFQDEEEAVDAPEGE